MAGETTLYFDTEKSGESYVHLYANEPGWPADKPLWPAPIPVIGVSGKVGQGKTTFLLDIAAGPIKRIDVPSEMLKLKPNGYGPIDTFEWFWITVKSIPPGRFRVIALDVAEEIEQGVAAYVWEHPQQFGTTRQQFVRASGIYQGLVSSFWKSILMDITSRCETFAFANHVGLVFGSDGRPVPGKEKSKGRPVMKQSASLYINLTRDKDSAGRLKDIPAGVVDLSEGGKSRLMTWTVRNGVRTKVPVLPPRMPVATPQAIRDYFAAPPDTANLAAGELAPEHVMTTDERMALQLELERTRAETEQLRLQRLAEERRAAGEHLDVTVDFNEPEESNEQPVTAPVAPPLPSPPPVEPTPVSQPESSPARSENANTGVGSSGGGSLLASQPWDRSKWPQLAMDIRASVRALWDEFCHARGWPASQRDAIWKEAVWKKFNVASDKELTHEAWAETEFTLAKKLDKFYWDNGKPQASPFRGELAQLDHRAA